jgi:glycosyltransferase involved in cell wall biosynthesis
VRRPVLPGSDDRDDLVVVLTYYSPYVSGLTTAARDVAEGLAARGRKVTVVTTRHERSLPPREIVNGVRVLRAPVLARLGKGTISPQFTALALRATRTAKVANLHLPMLEAGPITRRAHCPVVLTYQCDVTLPPGLLNTVQGKVIDASSRAAMRAAHSVGVTSEDYARHSRLWPAIEPRMAVIPPPCPPCPDGAPSYRDGDGPHVGFLGRIVAEKGLEFLVDGFRALADPTARLLIGGEFAKKLADFYASLDVFALPSVNAFEAFGIVQVVAMRAGVPVLASDLPGVRTPVRQTGFGRIVAPGDVPGITDALTRLRDEPLDRVAGAAAASKLYSVESVLDSYEALFDKAASDESSTIRN